MKLLSFSALALFLIVPALAGEQQNRFESATAGFSVEKPAAWRFASLEQVTKNRGSVRLKDEELQKQLEQSASAPLVVMMKHDEPYDGLNPSFQVVLRPLPPSLIESSPQQILELIIPTLERSFRISRWNRPSGNSPCPTWLQPKRFPATQSRQRRAGVFPRAGA